MATLHTPRISEQLDQELADAVLAYLAEHPAAMDTVEGIAEWWLMRQRVRVVVEQVERVLDRQAEDGVLEVVGAGPSRRYRLRARASRVVARSGDHATTGPCVSADRPVIS
jgi:hypothetical protein